MRLGVEYIFCRKYSFCSSPFPAPMRIPDNALLESLQKRLDKLTKPRLHLVRRRPVPAQNVS